MRTKTIWVFQLLLLVLLVLMIDSEMTLATVIRENKKTFIVDRTGERWDITQAVSIGFDPGKFEFGIGRNAFNPLDETDWTLGPQQNYEKMRIIGVAGDGDAHAYSVGKLRYHETANTFLGSKAIVAGY